MKKMLPWLITILLSITLIAIVSIILFRSLFNDPASTAANKEPVEIEKLSADKRVEVTAELNDFRRNLKDQEKVVIISFAFQLDAKKTKEDFDKLLEIEIKPMISRTLADTTAEELNGSQGEDALESKLLNLINPALPKGKLIKVEITDFIITEL
ncbi:flagellar basal body protein FliL [Paenibacillus sp. MY03]|jgi:flagellar FliL protein|uniref:Flagellar protein FliL n=1 Tax=Paenibacillus agaridevorans TaxID=171404 RepID=A0A2R5ESD6_9BACL|nr:MULTISPECIES: flagellar basal body-associated FliL family protein [Paenibacillus]OUS71592.1 flagellar basal body protein FliL [Paenibacillus sp. MY03]QNK54766.1 flagellar basal body-associated FliL family protein [Paenibacillus sp. PAMC21692]GBG09602.1 flagellar basal body protein FliL [Paenibacillus agaridevorans]